MRRADDRIERARARGARKRRDGGARSGRRAAAEEAAGRRDQRVPRRLPFLRWTPGRADGGASLLRDPERSADPVRHLRRQREGRQDHGRRVHRRREAVRDAAPRREAALAQPSVRGEVGTTRGAGHPGDRRACVDGAARPHLRQDVAHVAYRPAQDAAARHSAADDGLHGGRADRRRAGGRTRSAGRHRQHRAAQGSRDHRRAAGRSGRRRVAEEASWSSCATRPASSGRCRTVPRRRSVRSVDAGGRRPRSNATAVDRRIRLRRVARPPVARPPVARPSRRAPDLSRGRPGRSAECRATRRCEGRRSLARLDPGDGVRRDDVAAARSASRRR